MNTEQKQRIAQKRRAMRLAKIRQAVSKVEDRLVITTRGVRSDAFRALYYLERLAKRAR